MKKRALFIVDPQLDFMPGGSLAVPFGDMIVPVINSIISKFDVVIVSRDWHPEDHKSFTSNNPGTKVLDKIMLNGKEMKIWPPHCVQFTNGANFHPELQLYGVPIFTKGDDKNEHPFSGFGGVNDNGDSVEKYMRDNGVEEIYVVGLAGDYCVKETALDCSVFFPTYFIIDATRFIGDMTPTVEDMAKNGVMVINSTDLDMFMSDEPYHSIKDTNKKYATLKKT